LQDRAKRVRTMISRVATKEAKYMFHHIQKTGGTTVCSLAIMNAKKLIRCDGNDTMAAPFAQLETQLLGCNCNGPNPSPFNYDSPVAQLCFLKAYPDADMYFHEAPILSMYYGTKPYIYHATTIRNPYYRYISHMLQFYIDFDVRKHTVAEVVNFLEDKILHSPVDFKTILPDNIFTRILSGTHITTTITDKEFRSALDNLNRMDVILNIENFHQDEEFVKSVLNFESMFDGFILGNRSTVPLSAVYNSLSSEASFIVRQRHQWDLMLYMHGLSEYEATLTAWKYLKKFPINLNLSLSEMETTIQT
jgi:hypothetical protein